MIADKRTPLGKAKDLFDKGDPDSIGDRIVRLREEKSDGTLGRVGFQAEVKGISKGLLHDYQRVSSHLHSPSPDVLCKGKKSDISMQKSSLQKILQEIEEYVDNPTLLNLGTFVNFTCSYCNSLNVKNKKILSEGSQISCTGKDCGAQYIVCGMDSDTPQFEPVRVEWHCPCGVRQYTGIHQLSYGVKVECIDCKGVFTITYTLQPFHKESKDTPESFTDTSEPTR